MVGLFVGTAAVAGSILAVHKYNEQMERGRQVARDAALLLEEHVRRTIGATDLILGRVEDQVVRGSVASLAGDVRRYQALRHFAEVLPEVGSIGIVDASGQVVMNSSSPVPNPANVSDREYFLAHRSGGTDFWIGPALFGRASGEYGFTISRRMKDAEGAFAGVIVAAIGVDYFAEYLKPVNLGPNAVTSIVRDDRTILLRHPFDPQRIGRDFLETRIFQDGVAGGSFISVSLRDGVERLISFRRVPGLPIIVAAGVATEDSLQEWYWLMRVSAGLGLAVAAALALLTWLALRSIRKEELAQQALLEDRRMLEARVGEATAELRTALANKDLLFKEVNHRVRNSLNLTAGLLQLQSRNIADPAARRLFDEASQRVVTISRVHESLYRSSKVQTVEFAPYLRDLCHQLAETFSGEGKQVSLSVEAGPLDLPADTAIPLALVVNELVTNAYKYAHPDGAPGRIAVRCQTTESSLVLTVEDDGKGLPPDFRPADRTSLGMKLIVALVGQLRGTLTAGNAHPGARFAVEVPVQASGSDPSTS